jgi:hypothetical protein
VPIESADSSGTNQSALPEKTLEESAIGAKAFYRVTSSPDSGESLHAHTLSGLLSGKAVDRAEASLGAGFKETMHAVLRFGYAAPPPESSHLPREIMKGRPQGSKYQV